MASHDLAAIGLLLASIACVVATSRAGTAINRSWMRFFEDYARHSGAEREKSVQMSIEAFATASKSLHDLCSKVLMIKGLHPHLADPEAYTPSGISREDFTSAEVYAQRANEAMEDAGSVGDDIVGRYEADKEEWERLASIAKDVYQDAPIRIPGSLSGLGPVETPSSSEDNVDMT